MVNTCVTDGNEGARKDREINVQIEKDAKRNARAVNLLLYGLNGSGKSSLAKQLKMGCGIEWTVEEREAAGKIIHRKILADAKELIVDVYEAHMPMSPDNNERAQIIMGLEEEKLSPSMGELIKNIWEDPAIQAALYERLLDVTGEKLHFLENIERISASNYVPTDQDILLVPPDASMGAIETEFEVENYLFRMIEVVGDGLERKWIHCFEDITAVVFCVALDEFDVYDGESNRMRLALELFEDLCFNRWFFNTGIILLFSNKARFEEKIEQVDITTAFPRYTGARDSKHMMDYITRQFLGRNPIPKRHIHPLIIIDCQATKLALGGIVHDIISNKSLSKMGMI